MGLQDGQREEDEDAVFDDVVVLVARDVAVFRPAEDDAPDDAVAFEVFCRNGFEKGIEREFAAADAVGAAPVEGNEYGTRGEQ